MKLEAIKLLCEVATPPPWVGAGESWGGTKWVESPAWSRDFPLHDASFITAARELVPALLRVADAASAVFQHLDIGEPCSPERERHNELGVALAVLEAL